MVNWLANKNRTDLPIIKVLETSKETWDQFDFCKLIFLTEFIFSVNKKELSQRKIKNNIKK